MCMCIWIHMIHIAPARDSTCFAQMMLKRFPIWLRGDHYEGIPFVETFSKPNSKHHFMTVIFPPKVITFCERPVHMHL